jgi:predicted NBD/HSP70 family sugar kinase
MRNSDLKSLKIASSETARDINRRIVLDLIRRRQPISRADLARLSGMQRSTISLIADQLVEEHWVSEGAYGNLPRGRKPRFLHLNTDRAGIIGVNVRPTQTTIAVANLNANFLTQESFATSGNFEEFMTNLKSRIRYIVDSHPNVFFEGIGISVPGRVELLTQKLVFAPNLKWQTANLKSPLEREFGLPVEIENAANACALAEIWFETRSEGVSDLIVVTVSEGIGTGIITNGQLVRGNGSAGEFGHVSISENGRLCKCGNQDCWEIYASNQAAVREYAGDKMKIGKTNQPDPAQISFDDVLRLAQQRDSKARAALEKMAYYMGVGLAMMITGISPKKVILIGEFTRAWDIFEPIIDSVIEKKSKAISQTKIVAAADVLQPRLRGAVALILQKHISAPLTA